MKLTLTIAALCLVCSCYGDSLGYGERREKLKPTQFLRSYQNFINDFYRKNDAYKMEYHVGDSHRFEERTDSGEVRGTYAFVAPEGDEYEFKYEANDDGFKVEGDALPEAPEETDDVKAARDAFFEAYEKQLELTGDYEYDSDEYEEDSDEDSDESDESDEDDESSEESSEESDEDSDESDEDEEEEDEDEEPRRSSSFFSVPYPYGRRSRS